MIGDKKEISLVPTVFVKKSQIDLEYIAQGQKIFLIKAQNKHQLLLSLTKHHQKLGSPSEHIPKLLAIFPKP